MSLWDYENTKMDETKSLLRFQLLLPIEVSVSQPKLRAPKGGVLKSSLLTHKGSVVRCAKGTWIKEKMAYLLSLTLTTI